VIKIEVTPAHRLMRPKPGQHYFIYKPLSLKGWENHPFTLGHWDRELPHTLPQMQDQVTGVDSKEIKVSESLTSPVTEASSSTAPSITDAHHPGRLTFWIRPFDGWTKQIRDQCLKAEHNRTKMRLLIEGPYGHNAHLEMFESALIVVGGTGFSAGMPYIEEYLHCSKTSALAGNKHAVRTRHIHLVWACRNAVYIRDVCRNELAPAFNRTDIRMDFHTTGKNYSSTVEPGVSMKSDKEYGITEKSTFSQDITISQGRPNISAIIQEAAEKHTSRTAPMGKLAVFVCGPAGMADVARDSVCKILRSGYSDVEYFEESFGW
jgi:NAD(P)H-flavin reductase